jgi:hypothetical protein
MAPVHHAETVAAAWEHALRTSPDPLRAPSYLFSDDPVLYRERLTEREVNYLGEVIPRIERVRRNLRRLGSVRLDPGRLR